MDALLDAIKDKQSITKLTTMTNNWTGRLVDSAMVKRLTNQHPALIELDLRGYQFTANDAIALIRQLHSLSDFRFSLQRSEYSKFSSQLDDREWIHSRYHYRESNIRVMLSRRTHSHKMMNDSITQHLEEKKTSASPRFVSTLAKRNFRI